MAMTLVGEKIFTVDQAWANKYPHAKAGILVIENIENTDSHPELNSVAAEVECKLQAQYAGFSREQLNELPIIKTYNNYYKNFGKTYHVRAQLESIVNGKPLSSASAVITAMFIAEVKNMLLTAGHDCFTLELPARITVASGKETFTDIRKAEKTVPEGDMIMMDGEGVISSIILGPDSRTKLTPSVQNVMFAVYAPAEVEKELVHSHMKDIETYVKTFSPTAETQFIEIFEA